MDGKLREMNQKMQDEEKKTAELIEEQEKEIDKVQHEIRLAQLRYWEKVQEYRLCELKLKELWRHRWHRELKPLGMIHSLPS